MEAKNPAFQRWDYSHSPVRRPMGCNNQYGPSGAVKHERSGEVACVRCKRSRNHYRRELKRDSPSPRKLQPCGTHAAAGRHRAKGEPLDLACRVAEAAYKSDSRKLARENP